MTFEGAFDYVFIAFFEDERPDVFEVRAAVVVVVVGDHAGGEVYGDFVFFYVRVAREFFGEVFEFRGEARPAAAAAGERHVAHFRAVAASFEEPFAPVEAVHAGEAAAS